MRGGSLTRYYPPYQRGAGATEDLIKIASPVLLNAMQSGLQAAASGRSLSDVGGVVGHSLKRGLKRKAGALVKAGLKAGGRHAYKKAKRRVTSIFGR